MICAKKKLAQFQHCKVAVEVADDANNYFPFINIGNKLFIVVLFAYFSNWIFILHEPCMIKLYIELFKLSIHGTSYNQNKPNEIRMLCEHIYII